MNSGRQDTACCDHICTDPVEVSAVYASGDAFHVGHLRIELSGAMVFQFQRKNIIETKRFRPRLKIDKGLEAYSVPELMEKDRHEVHCSRWWIGVKTIIPNQRECAGSPDATVESRADVTSAWVKVNAGQAIRESHWVPSLSHWCPDEVAKNGCGTSGPERRGSRVAT